MTEPESGKEEEEEEEEDKTGSPFTDPDLQQIVCQPGRIIFEQDMPAHQAFYIEKGRVEVSVHEGDHTITLAEIGAGEIFGEMGVLEQENRMATITAIDEVHMTVIPRKEIDARINNVDDPVVSLLLKGLFKRLRSANKSQIQYYKSLSTFQNQMAGLMHKAKAGIDEDKREEFAAEITPLLEKIEQVLDKYKK